MSKVTEVKVPGTDFVIKDDQVYKIEDKLDKSAPDGFQKHGLTKYPSLDVKDIVYAPYDEEAEVWDLGFTKESPCLSNLEESEASTVAKKLEEFIKKPFIAQKGGKESFLSQESENTFLDTFKIELQKDRIFDTKKPKDRLSLYLALLNKSLTPPNKESDPRYSTSSYVVVNREESVNKKQEIEFIKDKAISKFFFLLEQDRDQLIEMLKFSKAITMNFDNDMGLQSAFKRYIEKDNSKQNAEMFLDLVDEMSTDKGRDKLYIYSELKKAAEDMSNDNIVNKRGTYMIKGDTEMIEVGGSLQQAASFIQENKSAKGAFEKYFLEDED